MARVKVNGHYGDWISSMFGTSAGTNLGPLLFIMYMHDIPKRIFPKFADDLVSVAVDSDMLLITKELQQSVDELVSWSRKWGMVLNVSKTKVMLFGNVDDDVIKLKMYGADIEQVSKVSIWVFGWIISLIFRIRLIMRFRRRSDQQLKFVVCLMVEMDFLYGWVYSCISH